MNSADAATRLASPRFEQMVKGGQSAPINIAAPKLAAALTRRAVSPLIPAPDQY
jgi:hypothetical protein